jgi:HEPN domain-containing protein
MKSGLDLARELLQKAENDLAAARVGLIHGAPLDTVCFHLQQVVEKLLKAALNCHAIAYPRTHDIDELMELAIVSCPAIAAFVDRFEAFSAYAIEFRYSTDFYPSREEVINGLDAVEEFRSVLRPLLPCDVLPGGPQGQAGPESA